MFDRAFEKLQIGRGVKALLVVTVSVFLLGVFALFFHSCWCVFFGWFRGYANNWGV